MKKALTTIVAVFFIVPLCSSAYADCTNLDSLTDNRPVITPYPYPILPGTDEWNSLTMDERIEVSFVSSEIAEKMTTDALFLTTLNYPFIINIYAYSSPAEGIDIVREYFPPLEELFHRADAYQVVSAYLAEYEEPQSGNNISYYIANRIFEYISAE